MGRVDGKVALVTGGAKGMGAAFARRLVVEGARVAITDVDTESGEALAEELGDACVFLEHDVTDADAWTRVVAEIGERLGPVTVLVNNAGFVGPAARLGELAYEDYLRVVAIDQHGTFLGTHTVIPGMVRAGGGSIVNISSTAGLGHPPGAPNGAYTTAKFAVRGMAKAAAVEYGPQQVRVNSVHPGPIRTVLLEEALSDEARQQIGEDVPLGRLGEPDEVAQLVLFLASDESSFITGAEIAIDGGRHAT